MRTRTAVTAAVLAIASLGGASASTPSTPSWMAARACASPVHVPVVGLACPTPAGWLVLLADGSTITTHGVDPAPSASIAAAVAAAPPVHPACVTDALNEFHGVLVYVHAVDRPDRSGTMAPEMRSMAASANGMLRQEAGEFGRTLDYRMLCDTSGALTVFDASLPVPEANVTFETLTNGLRALGYSSPMEKYWVFYDGHPPLSPGGTGSIEGDAHLGADNRNNYGPSWAVTWGYTGGSGAFIMMHENGHNLGAVQNFALHSSGGYHCNDGLDVMCYADGGPTSNYTTSTCPTLHFDCNHDDYFNPVPPETSLLNESWNLASPYNRFLSGCLYATGVMKAGTTDDRQDISGRSHAIPALCQNRAFALSGVPMQPPVGGNPTSSAAGSFTGIPDYDVCWLAGATTLSCFSARGPEHGTVPTGATSARVVLKTGGPSTYVLSIV